MPNHVHLILVPGNREGLARALGDMHRRYTTFINARARWSSFPEPLRLGGHG
jgi:putative transposase